MPVPTTKKPEPTVVYPEIRTEPYIGSDAIGIDLMKELLGWEDEDSYRIRVQKGATNSKKAVVGFGDEYLLKDPAGKKVRCWYNTKNRPFSLRWAQALAQSILHSGPGIPVEKRIWQVNGEPMIFGRYGQCLSGQHRGIGLILAVYEYRKNKDYWLENGGWSADPVLETILIVGIDESPRTTRTIDNVKPRTLSDVFYTSDVFSKLTQPQREMCSKILQTAVNLLWKRTGVSDDEAKKFQVHGESVSFFERHPKLLECVDHIYSLNSGGAGRRLVAANLSAGLAAGLLYLTGCSNSDPDEYYGGVHARSERCLDWGGWQLACDFWTHLAEGTDQFVPVKDALGLLVDPESGEGGRQIEKIATIARAWQMYMNGTDFDAESLKLEYHRDPVTGKTELVIDDDFPDFSGIDKGEDKKTKAKSKPVPPEQERERIAAEIREKNRIAQLDATAKGKPVPTHETNGEAQKPLATTLLEIKAQHPGKLILFRTKDGYAFWGNDAQFVSAVLQQPATKPDGKLDRFSVSNADIEKVKQRLLKSNCKVAICSNMGGKLTVEDVIKK